MARARTLLDWLTLDPESGQPLYRQIYEQIRNAVVSGQIAAGTSLPASRSLVSSLGVSRITVLHAYNQLIAEGFLESRPGSGTRVASLFGDDAKRQNAIATSAYGERIDHAAQPTIQSPDADVPTGLAFQPGIPGFDTFPRLIWSRLLLRHGRRAEQSMMDYAHVGGYAPLRQALTRYLVASRGVSCTPDQVVITSSARSATMLVCDVLLCADDTVVTEDPGYVTGRECLKAAGMRIAPVPVDEDGLRVEEILQRAPDARLACVTPSHQWPTGVTLFAFPPPRAARMGARPRRLDSRGRLRQRVPFRRSSAYRLARPGGWGSGSLLGNLCQSARAGDAMRLSGGPSRGGRGVRTDGLCSGV